MSTFGFHGTRRLVALFAATLLLPFSASAEPRLGGLEKELRVDLAKVTTTLQRSPHDVTLRHERLRLLHALSVEDASLIDSARIEVDILSREAPASQPLWMAYTGALHIVDARHTMWPHERAQALRRGLPLLDSAVGLRDSDVEIRHLRLVSGYYLPAILGRKGQVREDFDALGRLLPGARGSYPASWFITTVDFVLEHGSPGKSRTKRLLEARRLAAVGDGTSRADAQDGRP